jgi:hypothetical protein
MAPKTERSRILFRRIIRETLTHILFNIYYPTKVLQILGFRKIDPLRQWDLKSNYYAHFFMLETAIKLPVVRKNKYPSEMAGVDIHTSSS